MQPRRGGEQAGNRCNAVEELFEVVENKQDSALAEIVGERIGERDSAFTDTERLGDSRNEERRIPDRREVDEGGSVAELRRKLLGCRDLEPPSDQRRRGRGKPSRRGSAGFGRGERRILAEDRALQLAELPAWLEAQLVGQHSPRDVIRLERLLLPARAVQREHVLLAQAFPVGLLGDQPLELADERTVLAQRQASLVPKLERTQPRVVERARFCDSQRLIREIGQSRTAPQLE